MVKVDADISTSPLMRSASATSFGTVKGVRSGRYIVVARGRIVAVVTSQERATDALDVALQPSLFDFTHGDVDTPNPYDSPEADGDREHVSFLTYRDERPDA